MLLFVDAMLLAGATSTDSSSHSVKQQQGCLLAMPSSCGYCPLPEHFEQLPNTCR
jgi:hypothetical protein